MGVAREGRPKQRAPASKNMSVKGCDVAPAAFGQPPSDAKPRNKNSNLIDRAKNSRFVNASDFRIKVRIFAIFSQAIASGS